MDKNGPLSKKKDSKCRASEVGLTRPWHKMEGQASAQNNKQKWITIDKNQ